MMSPAWTVVVDDGIRPSRVAPLQGPIDQVATRAAALGFDGIVLTVNRPEELDAVAILTATRSRGLAITGIATGSGYTIERLSLGADDPTIRAAAVERMRHQIDLAVDLGPGTKVVIGAIRGRAAEAAGPAGHAAAFQRSLSEVVEHAGRREVVLLLEVMNRLDADLLCDLAATAELIRQFATPWLRLQADTHHMRIMAQGPDELLSCGDLLAQVDLAGADRGNPATDDFDFRSLFTVLDQLGFAGDLSLEFAPAASDDDLAAALRHLRGLQQLPARERSSRG